jgi:glycerol-3-phosphate dehydrogenase (NAD(P)+)
MQTTTFQTVLVLGAGNFGTCLAQHLASIGHNVHLWTRDPVIADTINLQHKNPRYLSTITLSNRIAATNNLTTDLINSCSTVLVSIPTQGLREVLEPLKGKISDTHLVISAAKGIEINTLELPHDIIRDCLGERVAYQAVALSGPSFASEIATQQPTGVSAASKDSSKAQLAQEIFHSPYFRVYTSDDPIGLEVAGALKNVIAIAAGACAGIGFQANANATLITRGLREITRFGQAMGANPLTFTGLGGVGDLFLTCTSVKSRNYTVGFKIGKGEILKEIMNHLGSVAEGVFTAKAAYSLAKQLGVEAPITEQVYLVLHQGKPVAQAVNDLMNRDAKEELL